MKKKKKNFENINAIQRSTLRFSILANNESVKNKGKQPLFWTHFLYKGS